MYTGKTKIIARYRSYHGSTSGSIAATGDPRRWAMEPARQAAGHHLRARVQLLQAAPSATPTRGCDIACADYLEHMIRNESDVAAVIVEPIVGTNGVIVPPDEYMPKLRRICDETGVLLIADEVMSGWGRTGKWFAMDHWGVTPDILTTAKGITSAYVPLGLCATSDKIADFFQDHYFAHGHTYEAHPMTLAPAVATIHEMQRLDLVERAAELGALRRSQAAGAQGKAPQRRRCARQGPLLGRRTREEPHHQRALQHLRRQGLRQAAARRPDRRQVLADGVIIQAWVSHFVIAPPLIVTKEEIDRGIAPSTNT